MPDPSTLPNVQYCDKHVTHETLTQNLLTSNASALFYSAVVRLNPGEGIIPMVGVTVTTTRKSYVKLHHLHGPPLKLSSPVV